MASPRCRVIGEEHGFRRIYREIAGEVPTRGNLVPDAHLAALLRKHGVCGKIPTSDYHFERSAMFVTEKGQVTIPKLIRTAAGVLPGSEVAFSLEAGKIVIRKVSSGIKTDRRDKLRAAGARVRKSMSPEFRQMSAGDIIAFLRADNSATVGKKRGGR